MLNNKTTLYQRSKSVNIFAQQLLGKYLPVLEEALKKHLPLSAARGTELLNQALLYSIFPGGKRMRPIFALLGGNIVSAQIEGTLIIACAVEYIHTASLLLDDLPSMDNSTLRRGRTALHEVFGEEIAILSAVALLNKSYELFARAEAMMNSKSNGRLVIEAAQAIGEKGMIAGQASDLWDRQEEASCSLPEEVFLKTTGLMVLTLSAAAIAARTREVDIVALRLYGEHLGTAFQLLDNAVDHFEDGGEASDLPNARRQKAFNTLETAGEELLRHFNQSQSAMALVEISDSIFRRYGLQVPAGSVVYPVKDLDLAEQDKRYGKQ